MTSKLNKENFSKLIATNRPSNWTNKHLRRKTERSWKKNSAIIALNVLTLLEQRGWSQARLAKEMEVSAAHISKIVKGQINFTLESISKLEFALGKTIVNFEVIDPEREQRNYKQIIEWLEESKPVRTTESTKKVTIAQVSVTHSISANRSVLRKEFNLSTVADNNLRPTG